MPTRTPSNASAQLRRSKSSSNVRPQQLKHAKSFNTSELQHQEALTAAELAFERARERHAAENGFVYTRVAHTTFPALQSDGPQLSRRQSVRFTGSDAVKTRELPNTRRDVSDKVAQTDRRQPIEYVETIVASEPSSYRKLRKAKSMLTPDHPPSVVSTDGIPTTRSYFKRDSMRSSDSHNDPLKLPDRRLRRSFSFLRGVADRLPTSNHQYVTNDQAIQLARDQYLRQLEEQRLKEQPSFLNLAKRRKSSKEIRRTVRTSGGNSYGIAGQLPLTDQVKVKSIGRKARAVSQTLKRALKKVFGRPLPDDLKMPEQHLFATKSHYVERPDDDNTESHYYPPIPSPDIELLRRVDSRESILREISAYGENTAPAASIKSVNTEDEELSNQQSRVTSWTNSTIANTISMPQFVERKRLSIIREDGGPHQPSSSTERYVDSQDGYAVFRQPVRLDNAGPAAAQRVYSALQRQIRNSEPIDRPDDSELGTESNSDQSNSRQSQDTLRKTSSGLIGTDGPYNDDSLSHCIPASKSFLFNPAPPVVVNGSFLRLGQESHGLCEYKQEHLERIDRPTPQQIAHINEPELPPPKKPLREDKSAFFPSTSRIERPTTSPYRCAMYENSENASQIQDDDRGIISNSQMASPRLVGPSQTGSAVISESVYSRSSGGHSPRVMRSSMSLPKSESSGTPGIAVIITSGPQSSEKSLPPHYQRRQPSDKSSMEWKRWMASEVASLEDRHPKADGIFNALPIIESGHRRENAQWDEEDVAIHKSYVAGDLAKESHGTLKKHANARPVLREWTSRSNVERVPFKVGEAFENEKMVAQKENTPKKRSGTPWIQHSAPDDEKKLSIPTNSASVSPCQKASQVTLSPHSQNKRSPAGANARTSPERAERLRRLPNKSSQSLNKASNPPGPDADSNENRPAHISPASSPYASSQIDQSFSTPSSQVASSKALVSRFLTTRRIQMRSSDESGGDPIFL